MSMISLSGILVNVFTQPRKGEIEEKDKIQILGDIPIEGGEIRKDLVTVTVNDATQYKDLEGTEISIPVGVFAPSKGSVIFYVPKR